MKVKLIPIKDYPSAFSISTWANIKLEDMDLLEIQLLSKESNKELAIIDAIIRSKKVFIITINNKIEGVFGLTGNCPWLLMTNKVRQCKKQLIKKSKSIIAEYLAERPEGLWGVVHVDNIAAQRFLRHIGFSIQNYSVDFKLYIMEGSSS